MKMKQSFLLSIIGEELLQVTDEDTPLSIPPLEKLSSHRKQVLDVGRQHFDAAPEFHNFDVLLGYDMVVRPVRPIPGGSVSEAILERETRRWVWGREGGGAKLTCSGRTVGYRCFGTSWARHPTPSTHSHHRPSTRE